METTRLHRYRHLLGDQTSSDEELEEYIGCWLAYLLERVTDTPTDSRSA